MLTADSLFTESPPFLCDLIIISRKHSWIFSIYFMNYYLRSLKMSMVSILKFRTLSLSLSNEMWVIKAGIHKLLVRIANREDPDQTASSKAVFSGSGLFFHVFLASI